MPALDGQIILSMPKGDGTTGLVVTINFDASVPARPLVARAVQTTSGSRTGALVVDNQMGRSVRVVVRDPDSGIESRAVRVPAGGAALTVAQCAAQGYTTQADFNGFTVDWAG